MQSNEVKGNYHMEKEGLHCCMDEVHKEKQVRSGCSGNRYRHKQINKWLREVYPIKLKIISIDGMLPKVHSIIS